MCTIHIHSFTHRYTPQNVYLKLHMQAYKEHTHENKHKYFKLSLIKGQYVSSEDL